MIRIVFGVRLFRIITKIVVLGVAIVTVHSAMIAIFCGFLDNVKTREDQPSIKMSKEILRYLYDNKYTELVSNRTNVPLDDRHIIYVIGELNTRFDLFFRRFFLFHPQVIYFESLSFLLGNSVSDDTTYNMDVFVNKLYSCHFDMLSEFVHYANDMLIRTSKAPWCINRKPRSKSPLKDIFNKQGYVPLRNHLGNCIPPSSRIFKNLCSSHHLAIHLSNKEYTFMLNEQNKRTNTNILVFLKGNVTSESYCGVLVENVTSRYHDILIRHDISQEIFVIKTSTDFDNMTMHYCMFELCNYLDTYLNITYVKDIMKLSFV